MSMLFAVATATHDSVNNADDSDNEGFITDL